jgi:Zn-dependent peptidase ImmA (M78 family)
MSDVYSEDKKEKLPFVGRFSIKDNPIAVAQDILKTLNINPSNYQSDNVIKEWINAAETNGIFVSRTSFIHSRLRLDSEELQGFAIADPYAPFVFVNSDDWNAPQLFTLVHELAHIWIAETGISNDIEPDIKNKDKHHPVEVFCNEVAANALMPKETILKFGTSIYQNFQDVFKTAKTLGVSSFAFLIRALNLNQIAAPLYQKLKKQAEIEYIAYLKKEEEKKATLKLKQKEKPGGPNPYLLRLNKNSRLFTQVVLDALRSGYVQPTQASLLLGTPANNFHKLESQIYR